MTQLIDPATGEVIRTIKNGNRWRLRHKHELTYEVSISQLANNEAIVDVLTTNPNLMLRERWGSTRLAVQHYLKRGYEVKFYQYFPLLPL